MKIDLGLRLYQIAEKVISLRLLKKGQMQCAEILRVVSRRIRSDFLPRRRVGESAEAYLAVRRNDEG